MKAVWTLLRAFGLILMIIVLVGLGVFYGCVGYLVAWVLDGAITFNVSYVAIIFASLCVYILQIVLVYKFVLEE